MRKRRIERNLAFPTEEFRMRVRTAAKERGFRNLPGKEHPFYG